jgi:hypothetical protein
MKKIIINIAKELEEGSITETEAQNLLLKLFGDSKSVCPTCGSNKLYYSTTGKLCCTKCVFG